MDLFRDGVWQFIGVIISVLSLILAIYVDKDKIFKKSHNIYTKTQKKPLIKNFKSSKILILISFSALLISISSFVINFRAHIFTKSPLENPTRTAYVDNLTITTTPYTKTNIAFIDTFDTNTRNWSIGEEAHKWGNIDRSIEKGKYLIQLNTKSAVLYTDSPKNLENLTYGHIEATFKQHNHNTDVSYGLFFLASDKKYYAFRIRDDGRFQIVANDNEKGNELLESNETDFIKPYEQNTLSIDLKQSGANLMINNHLIKELQIDIYKSKSGIIISANSKQSIILEIDDFRVIKQ